MKKLIEALENKGNFSLSSRIKQISSKVYILKYRKSNENCGVITYDLVANNRKIANYSIDTSDGVNLSLVWNENALSDIFNAPIKVGINGDLENKYNISHNAKAARWAIYLNRLANKKMINIRFE